MRNVGLWILVVGCSGDGEPVVEEPGGTNPIETGSPGELGFTVVPDDGWVRVAPLANVVVTATPGFDADAVAAAQVGLTDMYGFDVPFTVRLEGPRFIVDPVLALWTGEAYTIQITGLAYEDGTPLPTIDATFETHPYPPVVESQFQNLLVRSTYDARLRPFTSARFTDPGPDATWGTADDVQTMFEVTDANAEPETTVSYDSPGMDGTWGTGDDRIVGYETLERSEVLHHLQTYERGRDGVWFTGDDEVVRREESTFDEDSFRTAYTVSEGIGADGIWFTADDRRFFYWVFERDDEGLPSRNVRYSGPGPDGVRFTEDDVVLSYFTHGFAEGRFERRTSFDGPGLDGEWLNEDDTISDIGVYTFDDRGNTVRYDGYTGPGDDGEWFTDDDLRFLRRDYAFDEDGLPVSSFTTRGPGPDAVWSTEDDERTLYDEKTFDAEGHITTLRLTNSAGDDGVWGTEDDGLHYLYTFLPASPAGPAPTPDDD